MGAMPLKYSETGCEFLIQHVPDHSKLVNVVLVSNLAHRHKL